MHPTGGVWPRKLARATADTYLPGTETLPSGNHSVMGYECGVAARLVSGLSGPARMTCMTMDADQLHPPSGDGPVATADERRNIAGLDHVMNVLQLSPLVKKLPACKNELLHAFFRDDSLARTKGEPIAMWLVRYNEQLSKLNRVGIDIVTALLDVAGWQALNLAEHRIERVVSRLPDDTFPVDTISAELNRVFASVHMSEPVSSTPATPPGHAWGNELHELCVLIIARDSPDPHLRQKEPKIILLRPHSGTRLGKLSIPRMRTMTAATPLIRATCKNTCEMNSWYWPPAWTMAKMMPRFQVWTIPNWKQHV